MVLCYGDGDDVLTSCGVSGERCGWELWGRSACDLVLGFSHFTRRYCGNPGWFLLLRLLICLNSAGNLVWSQISVCFRKPAAAMQPRRRMLATTTPTNGEQSDRRPVRRRTEDVRCAVCTSDDAKRQDERPFRDDPMRRQDDNRRLIYVNRPLQNVTK